MTGVEGARVHTLPVLAGVLLALSFPPFPVPLAIFGGLVPLLLFIAERPPGGAGRWQATRGGVVTGVVYFGIQLYWMAVALLRYSALAIPAYLGIVLVLAALSGAFAWAVHVTRDRLQLPLPLLAAIFWTALEWLQAHLGDLAFPWLGLGTALAPVPTLAGAADLVGARGLTFWIAGTNGLIAAIILRHRAGLALVPHLTALLATLAIPAGYGAIRASSLHLRPAARVAVVQPDISDDVKRGPRGLDTSLAALSRLTLSLEGEALDLVAWPEVALPADFLGSDRLRAAAQELSIRVDAPILVGAYGAGDGADSGVYNSAFLIQPRARPRSGEAGSRDRAPARYDKQKLVPFIERVPFVDPRLLQDPAVRAGEHRLGSLERGRGRPMFRGQNGAAFGLLICYESIFAPMARAYRADGADFIVNITNDAWYGFDTPLGRTTGLWQHPAHLVLRAIETRAGVVRAANTGISMFIDPLGRSYGRTSLFETATATGTVYTTDTTTLFVRWGDWVGGLAVVFAAVALLVAWRQTGHVPRSSTGCGASEALGG